MGSDDKVLPQLVASMPGDVRSVIAQLRGAGGEAWIVGGAVREAWRGRPTRDWDLATSLRPARLAALFPGAEARDLRLGALHLRGEQRSIAITTLREEGGYSDHRHPDWVRFVDDPALDAQRRDFTVNAIYCEPQSGRLIDPCGGTDDLGRRTLRAIGDPAARFREDPLRLLRAVRFAAAVDLEIEAGTARALRASAPLLRELSPERVFDELTSAFTGDGRGRALRMLVELGLAAHVVPEVVALDGVPQPPEFHPEGDVLTHVCLVLEQVSAGEPVQAWSAVLHDLGKPATFERAADRIRFSGHDKLSAQMAREVLLRLHAPRELLETVVEVCRDHIRFASLPEMNRGKRERWLRSPRFGAHLAFHRADCAGSHGDLSIFETASDMLRRLPPEPPPPLLSGADVIRLGIPEGPVVGQVLRDLQQQLDALAAPSREDALRLLEANVRRRIKDHPQAGR